MLYNLKTIKISLNVNDIIDKKANSPDLVFAIAKQIFSELDADQEHMLMFSLDSRNHLRGYKVISSGGQTTMTPDFKIIFRNALLLGAVNIILAHNHPSGDLTPSTEDLTFTQRLKQAAEIMDISLIDHLIITNNGYYSFKNSGLL